jgi:hypothetical protein
LFQVYNCKSCIKVITDDDDDNKLYYDRSITTDLTVHNNRPNIDMLDKTIKEAYLINVAIPKSHNLFSTIIQKLQKYTNLQEELTNMAPECGLYSTISIIHNVYYPKKT